MELWLTLIALYAWQCSVRLPEGSAVFGPRWHRGAAPWLRGVHWLSPRPSTLGVVAMRMPFHLSQNGLALVAHSDLSRGGSPSGSRQRTVELDAGASFEEHGALVTAGGRPFVACASKAWARVWQRSARVLVEATAEGRVARWRAIVADSLDTAALEARLHDARRRTRWLGRTCDALALGAFVATPLIGAALGAEAALVRAGPILALLAVVALLLAGRAHRALLPEQRAARATLLLQAALYPPALLRLCAQIVDDATVGAHPLAWLAVLGQRDAARTAWAREIAVLERRARIEPDQTGWLALCCETLRDARPRELDPERAPSPRDPDAESYCPVCLDEFRGGFGRCADCDCATTRYPVRDTV